MLKRDVLRSQVYRRYVASLPCVVSGFQGEGVDPHHIKGRGFGGSTKCTDLFCMPLKHELHQELHNIGWQSWENKCNFNQLEGVLATLEQAFEDGVIKLA